LIKKKTSAPPPPRIKRKKKIYIKRKVAVKKMKLKRIWRGSRNWMKGMRAERKV
jgi:hypothetical protein